MENPISSTRSAPPASAPPDQATPSGENSFVEIFSEFEQRHHGPARGQAIQGTVVSVTPDSIFVDIGRKLDGILPTQLFRDDDGSLSIHVGDKLLVSITGSDGEGSYTLSTIKGERPKDWSTLEKAFAERLAIAGVVTEFVKGGLRVDVGVPAFLPASRSGARNQADLEKLVGQEIQCKIIKLDTADEDVVVDRRAVLDEEETIARQKRLAELVEGAVLRGTVRSVTDFGAFVDLGGLDGLLHVTDMAWHRVAKPSDIVSPGDSVKVKILKISRETRRISLGMKQLTPNPWTLASENFQVGQRVPGKVSRLTEFGAFIELAPGVDGLIHISEMSRSKQIKRPSDVLKPGESVEALVLGVNAAERRISLGLKQALRIPWEEAARKYAPGTVVEGPVSHVTKFGYFVDLGDGVEGMIHISDITYEKRLNHPQEELSSGQRVRAVVLELDQPRQRIKLGIKQLEPTSRDDFIADHEEGDMVSGRVLEILGRSAIVELGEGVRATCLINITAPAEGTPVLKPPAPDLALLTSMLLAKWKGGPNSGAPNTEPLRIGQVRRFRISSLDAARKSISVELATTEREQTQPPFRVLGVRKLEQPKSALQRLAAALGERAWMLDLMAGELFVLDGTLSPASIDTLAEFFLRHGNLDMDVSQILPCSEMKSELVLLGLYPSGAVRSLPGIIRRESSTVTLNLYDIACFIDPDSEIEIIPSGGLGCSLVVAAIEMLRK